MKFTHGWAGPLLPLGTGFYLYGIDENGTLWHMWVAAGTHHTWVRVPTTKWES